MACYYAPKKVCERLKPLPFYKSFKAIAATFYEHSDEIINFCDNRSTNASAQSINARIKVPRVKVLGFNDAKFFICPFCHLYA